MRINWLTYEVSDMSGGAIYDKNFYEIVKSQYTDIKVYDDAFFRDKYKKNQIGLIEFNKIYKDNIKLLLDCDILIMNSRLYTRFLLCNIKRFINGKTKIVVIHHHNNYMNNSGYKRYVHKFFEYRQLRFADELVIPNQYIIDLIKNEKKMPPIVYLPSSFNKKEYKQSKLNNNRILFVGTIEPRKGIDLGIRAFKVLLDRFPNYKFTIAGRIDAEPQYYKKLIELVQKDNIEANVEFLGRVSSEELSDLYQNSDLFLFPSLLEGYGWVMIEAMARGLPVIAFNNSAIPYTVVDGKNGRLIENKNWKKMGEALISTLSNREMMMRYQEGAIDTFLSVPSQDDLNAMTMDYIKKWDYKVSIRDEMVNS